ncbi:hypothetical protein BT63DRAFT_420471 [Microthyrium microscopicum]|uniref:Uncharacterized protein n=1 Tax=Microthyrium microscopicum TaxID=703497 RepID=A0A6A6USI5_9PEZI|nr:hypothetical protein BT63DRAFT_420471 [Microthyrium microscopicum]
MLRPVARRTFATFPPNGFLSRFRGKSNPQRIEYKVQLHRPPFFTFGNLGRRALRILPLFAATYYFSPISVSFEDEKEAISEDGSDIEDGIVDEEDEDDANILLFLPVSWPKLGERTYYRGSDPEWQEYIKISKDKEKQKRVFAALVRYIRESMTEDPKIAHLMGKVDLDKGRHWLDVIFPPGPPRHYEQTGIAISDQYIALSVREVSEAEYHSISSLFNPTAAAKSVWSAMNQIVGPPADKIKALFGGESYTPPNNKPFGPPNQSGTPGPPMGPVGLFPPVAAPGNAPVPPTPGAGLIGDSQEEALSAEAAKQIAAKQAEMRKSFMRIFASPRTVDPPRGCIILSGLVECVGSRANATMDVVAAFDLFHDHIVVAVRNIRRLAPHQQRPRGGR